MANIIELDAGQVFSGKKSGVPVLGYDAPCDRTPAKSANYCPAPWLGDVIRWFIYGKGEPLYISGPTGCGKTSGVKQVAALLNYPVYELTGHNRLETPEMVGHWGVRGGETVWIDGPLTRAMREGALFILNEIDLLDPSTATGLNSVLDGSALCLVDNSGEMVAPAKGFKFVGTANTNGASDESGIYTGTLRQNAAFLNRFLHVVADYLPEARERALIKKAAPTLPDAIVDGMVLFARTVRDIVLGRDVADDARGEVALLSAPISTRGLERWAYWTEKLGTTRRIAGESAIVKALDLTIANSQDAASRDTLHELLQRIIVDAQGGKDVQEGSAC